MDKKIFILILILISFGIYSSAQDDILNKEIKYRAVKRDLSNVLVDLSKKSEINIVFNIIEIPEKEVSFYSPGYSLKNILDFLLKDTGLKYQVINKQIVIFKPKLNDEIEYFIKGYITDESTGEKLVYTNIYLPDFSQGTISNEYGFYSLKLPEGQNKLVFSYIGYYSDTINLDMHKDIELDISLVPKPAKLLNEVVIFDSRLDNNKIKFFEHEKISIARIGKLVNPMGEDDILRLTYILPGVLTGADGLGGIHVRGGDSAENMILMDGVPVYNSQHAIGLFSIFNSSIIKDARIIKSDFPARYGGSLSSIMDIRLRDGNKKKFAGELDMGFLTVKGLFEGPLINNKSSFIVSFRRTYLDVWNKAISDALSSDVKTKDFKYYFYDFNAKMNFILNKRNTLSLSFYKGLDNFKNKDVKYFSPRREKIYSINNSNWNWGNILFSLQWNHQTGRKTSVNSTLFYSKYNSKSYSFDVGILDAAEDLNYYNGRIFDSNIFDFGYKMDVDYFTNNKHKIKYGFMSVVHSINPFVYINSLVLSNISQDIPEAAQIRNDFSHYSEENFENSIYFEDQIDFNKNTSLNLGLHFELLNSKIKIDKPDYFLLEPRIILNQKLSKKSILNLSVSRMSQNIHTLANNGLGLPSEVLLPTTRVIKPETAWHFNMGLDIDLTNRSKLTMEAYYKFTDNLVSHKDGSYFILSDNSNWENHIPVGKGKMWGIESQWSYFSEKFKLWLNYTLSWSQRSYDDINDGNWFEYRFSRRHNINLILVYNATSKMNLFLTGVYGSGNPYTLPTQLTPDNILLYEKKNNWHLPSYQRIDIGMESKFSSNGIHQEVKIGVYNVLNRSNPYYLTFSYKNKQLSGNNFKEVYLFPFLPSASYKIIF